MPGEKAINEEYLYEATGAFRNISFSLPSSDLLIVNTSEIDFAERNEDLQELLAGEKSPP